LSAGGFGRGKKKREEGCPGFHAQLNKAKTAGKGKAPRNSGGNGKKKKT